MMDRLGVLLRRAKDIFQTGGLTLLIRRGFDFARCRLFQYGYYYLYQSTVREIDAADFMPGIGDFTFNIICSNKEADELAATTGYDFRRRFVNARNSLDKGAIAFCSFVKGEIVNIGWVALSEEAKKTLDPLLQKVDFSKGEAYIGGLQTIPEYRRKDLASYGSVRRLQFLKERGITNIRYAVSVSNIAAQRLAPRFGLEKYAEARYLKLLWWKFWKEIPLAQGGHVD